MVDVFENLHRLPFASEVALSEVRGVGRLNATPAPDSKIMLVFCSFPLIMRRAEPKGKRDRPAQVIYF